MPRNHISVDAQWWYATVAIATLVVVYVTQSPPEASLFTFALNVLTLFAALFCLAMDIRAIRRSESSWNPSRTYVAGALFTPLFLLYGYRRYRYVGLI